MIIVLWSVALAVPDGEALLMIDRKIGAPGTAVPLESKAVTVTLMVSPAASEPLGAMGLGVKP